MIRCRAGIAAVLLIGSLWLCGFTLLPDASAATQDEPLKASWFDDAVFIGDSIAGTLQAYAEQHGELGSALFFCRTNYSLTAAVNGAMLLYYRGSGYRPKELLPETGAKKVFFLLGMNDVGSYDDTQYASLWTELVDGIRAGSPEMRIYFQSVTPMARSYPNNALTNERIDRYNELLRDFCDENGCCYVDVAGGFKDENGALRAELCRDGYVHLMFDAGALWCELLRDTANYSRDPSGDWGTGESGSDLDLAALYGELASKAELTDMVRLSDNTVCNAYGIAPGDYRQGIAALSGDSVRVDELWLFEAVDDDAAVRIYDAATQRIAARAEETKGYLPDQYEITRHAVAVRERQYVGLFIGPASEEQASAFSEAIG